MSINRIAVPALIAATVFWTACRRDPQLATIAAGGDGPPTLVLLHGYGSSADRWAPFTQTIRLPPNGRFVFPQAPEMRSWYDASRGRAWWPLALASHIPPGGTLPDLSATRPAGLHVAASLVKELLQSLERAPGGPLFIGGYSQGAMVAAEVAFRTDARIDALVLLSGTLVDEASWVRELDKRRELPVFMSHGRADSVLPFELSDRFRSRLQAAGVPVTWVPFDGGHEIPAVVVGRLNEFLASLAR